MAEIYKIAQSWMNGWVHSGPGVRYPHVGLVYGSQNLEYEVSERQNTYWLKLGEGRWVCDRDSDGTIFMVKTGTTQAQPVPVQQVQEEPKLTEVDEESYTYVPDGLNITSNITDADFYNNIEQNFSISNLRGIFGMPYQFMPSGDPRIDGTDNMSSIGRKYANEIVTYMPLLLMTPGTPVFMGDYSTKDKNTLKEIFVKAGLNLDVNDDALSTIASKEFGKYYSLKTATTDYFKYVNPMCRAAAVYMNLTAVKVDGQQLGNKEWSSNVNDNFHKLFSPYYGCVAWYCDSDTSISDSFSNETSESMIASKVNSLSDYGRELNFLLGTASAETGYKLDALTSMENLDDSVATKFADSLGSFGTPGKIFKSLTNSIQTVAAGGKIIFPEIWSDSKFSRSYSIKLKLVSPDGDDLSIYLNIIVPILHLLGFTLPRESTTSHGFISPFLVRAFYKGLFNVDMGIITDLNIEKGKEGAWTKSGIPTVVDVSFTISDLYDNMYMTDTDHNPVRNIILMDYIGNLCGININEPDIIRGINLFMNQNIVGRIKDTWHLKIFGNLTQWVNNKYMQIFGKF